MRTRRSTWLRYAVAVGASVAAAYATQAFQSIGEIPPLALHLVAVILVSWMAGFGPGIVTLLTSAIVAHGLWRFERLDRMLDEEGWQLVSFLLLGLLTNSATMVLRRNEQRARQRRASLRATLVSIVDGVVVLDDAGRVTMMNPRAQTLTGWRHEDALGRSIDDVLILVDEQSRARLESPLARVERRAQWMDVRTPCLLIGKDRSERPIEESSAPIRADNGKLAGAVVVFRDVSEARAARQTIERSEAELSDFFEHAPVGIHWAAPDGRIVRVNEHELQLLGYTRDEYVGRPIRDFHTDPRAADLMFEELAAGRSLANVEATMRCKDGSIRWVRISSNALRRDGVMVHTRSFTRDITAQKQLELERLKVLEDAQISAQAKDRFIAMLSHELRTPLSPVVIGLADMLEDPSLPAATRERLETMQRNVDLEVRLIDDLLDTTSIAQGKMNVQREPTDVHALIARVLEICSGALHAKSLQLRVQLDARRSWVHGDPARLQQVLWNLVQNATKYTPTGGNIVVSTSDEPGGILAIRVTDTGIGLATSDRQRIFLPFEQVAAAIGTARGLGLGLSISAALVQAHGGTLKAASEGRGLGATFTVELPALETAVPGTGAVAPAPRAPTSAFVAQRVLVVEDHLDTARMLAQLLTRRGHVARSVNTIADALELVRQHPPDLVVSDISLPDGSGLDLMRELRALGITRGIALSGHGTPADLAKSAEAGFARHLVKPVDVQRLLGAIQELSHESPRMPAERD